MPEEIAEQLSRFTPDGSALDRDALLFAAGRASVRPGRRWPAVAGMLAACQIVTLVLLWPRPAPPPGPLAAPTVPPGVELAALPDADPAQLGSLNRRLLQPGGDDLAPPAPVDSLAPAGPPLHALADAPPPGLD
jgi:hypothetical protein